MKNPKPGRNLGSLKLIDAHYRVRAENGVLKFKRKYYPEEEICVKLMDILVWRLTSQ